MTEPIWIGLREALAIHDRLLVLYGGAEGVRDQTLLESALARPRQGYAYGDNPDLADLGTALVAGVVRNHPFLDGNKRTGFVLGVMFLELNGLEFVATEEDATQAVRLLAAGSLDEDSFKKWMCDNIAGWVRRISKK
jgi:death-on-curing protein